MKIKIISAILLMLLFFGCVSQNTGTVQSEIGKLKVVASFYPMYDFAKNVGGERVEVSILIPPGVEPHNFEATPSAIKKLSDANVFVMNGAGMELWAPNLLNGVANQNLIVVDASNGIELITAEEALGRGEEHIDEGEKERIEAEKGTNVEHEEEHSHGKYDPHIWLNPVLAKKQVENIKDAFVQADPQGREYYENNAVEYEKKLDALDKKLRDEILGCNKKEILITHATLGYFCQEYGCVQIPIEGISEEGEPSPSDLAKIVDEARKKNVSAVYFESLISPKSAQTLASEINGQVLVFNTVHGVTAQEEAAGKNYISLMNENLENIRKGLECK
ncbi:MAG: metal ABC transporter substrate-binding protein [Candidatus Micrarchaeia archaeon]